MASCKHSVMSLDMLHHKQLLAPQLRASTCACPRPTDGTTKQLYLQQIACTHTGQQPRAAHLPCMQQPRRAELAFDAALHLRVRRNMEAAAAVKTSAASALQALVYSADISDTHQLPQHSCPDCCWLRPPEALAKCAGSAAATII